MSVLGIEPRASYMLGKCYILSPHWICSGFVFNTTGSSYVAQADFEPALLSRMLRLQSCDHMSSPVTYFVIDWDLLGKYKMPGIVKLSIVTTLGSGHCIPFTEMKTEDRGR